MRLTVLHESMRRIRYRVPVARMSMEEADILECYLGAQGFVREARVDERTRCATVFFRESGHKAELAKAMETFTFGDSRLQELVPENSGRAMNRRYEQQLVMKAAGKVVRDTLFPFRWKVLWNVCKSLKFLRMGLRSLRRGHLEVEVLDATAITASMLRRDYSTAGSIMFLLEVGGLLEEWTHRKSVADLARSMSLKIDKVWKVLPEDSSQGGAEQRVLVGVNEVREGDRILVHTAGIIPLDGRVVKGECAVNQASMTGESIPVVKRPGGYVYAGTVVEEGECMIEVTQSAGSGKYDQVVKMIEESEKLKSQTEERAFHLADSLVPWSLAGTVVTWLLTRNVTRAMAFLMVDFSCALKLSMPLSVLSALREAGNQDITVKGGKYLEAIAEADTIVFDKTGTLTHAVPSVAEIITFDGAEEQECLRIAACLEEHYPHSVANAVVNEALDRGITHEEMHSNVNYVVAHGIASTIDGKKAIIGSYHFVFEDEKTVVPRGERSRLKALPAEYSHLYLAVGGRLKAVLCIFDPLREEAAVVIDQLHGLGISKVCMMTGDNERTAAAIAEKLQLDEYRAEVLPGDKAAFVKEERTAGRKVIMIGDGVNDAPALSEADVGIAISDGAAIAREISDVTIASGSLEQVVVLRRLAEALMDRINGNYRFIISFNGILILLGTLGVLQPASSALLHNGSTVVTGLASMTDLLPSSVERKRS